jgi:hypothetical protein
MHRIQIFTQSDTTFVKDGNFTFPAFDGEINFHLQTAMVAIGSVQIVGKDKTWNTIFDAIKVAGYLAYLQNRGDFPRDVATKQWVRKHCLSKIIESELPFDASEIDWARLEQQVDSEISVHFPLCV